MKKLWYKKDTVFYLTAILISVTVIISVSFYSLKTYSLFSEALDVTTYTAEPEEEGYSYIVSCNLDVNGISFKAKLGTKAETPISGMILELKDKKMIDLSSYKDMIIFPKYNCSNFNLTITLFEEGFSKIEESNTHRYLQLESIVSKNTNPISFELDDLPTPVFWYLMNNTNRENFSKKDLSKVTSIIFSNHPATPKGSELNIIIDKILFSRSKKPIIVTVIIILSFWMTVLFYRLITRNKINVVVVSKPDSKNNSLYNEIIATINSELQDPNLTLSKVSEKTNISVSRIKNILNEYSGMPFSDTLREQRIIMAATLLTDKKLDIKEIAYKVGFSHPSSFSRAFKNKYGIIPSEFRDKS